MPLINVPGAQEGGGRLGVPSGEVQKIQLEAREEERTRSHILSAFRSLGSLVSTLTTETPEQKRLKALSKDSEVARARTDFNRAIIDIDSRVEEIGKDPSFFVDNLTGDEDVVRTAAALTDDLTTSIESILEGMSDEETRVAFDNEVSPKIPQLIDGIASNLSVIQTNNRRIRDIDSIAASLTMFANTGNSDHVAVAKSLIGSSTSFTQEDRSKMQSMVDRTVTNTIGNRLSDFGEQIATADQVLSGNLDGFISPQTIGPIKRSARAALIGRFGVDGPYGRDSLEATMMGEVENPGQLAELTKMFESDIPVASRHLPEIVVDELDKLRLGLETAQKNLDFASALSAQVSFGKVPRVQPDPNRNIAWKLAGEKAAFDLISSFSDQPGVEASSRGKFVVDLVTRLGFIPDRMKLYIDGLSVSESAEEVASIESAARVAGPDASRLIGEALILGAGKRFQDRVGEVRRTGVKSGDPLVDLAAEVAAERGEILVLRGLENASAFRSEQMKQEILRAFIDESSGPLFGLLEGAERDLIRDDKDRLNFLIKKQVDLTVSSVIDTGFVESILPGLRGPDYEMRSGGKTDDGVSSALAFEIFPEVVSSYQNTNAPLSTVIMQVVGSRLRNAIPSKFAGGRVSVIAPEHYNPDASGVFENELLVGSLQKHKGKITIDDVVWASPEGSSVGRPPVFQITIKNRETGAQQTLLDDSGNPFRLDVSQERMTELHFMRLKSDETSVINMEAVEQEIQRQDSARRAKSMLGGGLVGTLEQLSLRGAKHIQEYIEMKAAQAVREGAVQKFFERGNPEPEVEAQDPAQFFPPPTKPNVRLKTRPASTYTTHFHLPSTGHALEAMLSKMLRPPVSSSSSPLPGSNELFEMGVFDRSVSGRASTVLDELKKSREEFGVHLIKLEDIDFVLSLIPFYRQAMDIKAGAIMEQMRRDGVLEDEWEAWLEGARSVGRSLGNLHDNLSDDGLAYSYQVEELQQEGPPTLDSVRELIASGDRANAVGMYMSWLRWKGQQIPTKRDESGRIKRLDAKEMDELVERWINTGGLAEWMAQPNSVRANFR